ncbi:MAG: GntR family transcriptional regulator [Actinocatenispora sp.]
MTDNTLGSAHLPLRDLVTHEIRQRILTGALEPGERLVEDRLAEELGVSRNPVRETIRVLATEGLVEVTPRRGAAVARPRPAHAEELFEIRMALEGLAARLAARRRSPATTTRLRALLDEQRGAVDHSAVGTVAELNTRFHTAVAVASGNEHLHLLVGPLLHRAQWVFLQTAYTRAGDSLVEHEGIYEAIAAGDEESAEALAVAHVAAARRSYLAHIAGEDSVRVAAT